MKVSVLERFPSYGLSVLRGFTVFQSVKQELDENIVFLRNRSIWQPAWLDKLSVRKIWPAHNFKTKSLSSASSNWTRSLRFTKVYSNLSFLSSWKIPMQLYLYVIRRKIELKGWKTLQNSKMCKFSYYNIYQFGQWMMKCFLCISVNGVPPLLNFISLLKLVIEEISCWNHKICVSNRCVNRDVLTLFKSIN